LGGISFGDPALRQTIADVCVAHGLRQHELEDRTKYPDRRDIRGEQVNVRLLAILLRLGDLLDMNSDRACPLLLNAACPLPADSLAHWTQNQRILHKMVAPDRIELRAECQNQEEHMFLQDWCQWLVQETRNAAVLVGRCHRLAEWKPPFADMDSEQRSIEILPAVGSRYFPSRWTFELDRDLILERFVRNVHERKEEFIRELLQNAFDANRCKMYLDLAAEKLPQPESPTKVDEAWRERYPVYITLETRTFQSELSGESEEKQVLTIDDRGLGMDRDVISRFFLQVGRSYYNTEEFRKAFSFVPTSRFGVGFLSVFSSSDDVRVETWNPISSDGPLRLRLRGAKSYLLTERGSRTTAGTKIEVVLQNAYNTGDLTKWIADWCRRVEFPVFVDEFGQRTAIRAESPDQFVSEIKDLSQPNASFAVRCHRIDEPGLEGELYIFTHKVNGRESWRSFVANRYREEHAFAVVPERPACLTCVNGIKSSSQTSDLMIPRIDFRGHRVTNLSRVEGDVLEQVLQEPIVRRHVEALLRAHLDAYPTSEWEAWLYKLELARNYEFLETFWDEIEGGVLLKRGKEIRSFSLPAVASLPVISVHMQPDFEKIADAAPKEWCLVSSGHLNLELPRFFAERLFSDRYPVSITIQKDGAVRSDWEKGGGVTIDDTHLYPFEGVQLLSTVLYREQRKTVSAINSRHPLMLWIADAKDHGLFDETQLREMEVKIARDVTFYFSRGTLVKYLESLTKALNLPRSLAPPTITESDFHEGHWVFGRKRATKKKSKRASVGSSD
jgi:hypothetical protein